MSNGPSPIPLPVITSHVDTSYKFAPDGRWENYTVKFKVGDTTIFQRAYSDNPDTPSAKYAGSSERAQEAALDALGLALRAALEPHSNRSGALH